MTVTYLYHSGFTVEFEDIMLVFFPVIIIKIIFSIKYLIGQRNTIRFIFCPETFAQRDRKEEQ